MGPEELLAAVEDARDLGDSAAYAFGVEAGGDAADVRQVGDGELRPPPPKSSP